jgi:glycosyltransferase involved in cell wall biosynthesis
MKLSIVIPAYNEAECLEKNVAAIKSSAGKVTKDYEIIIAEDGCTDSTPKIASLIAKKGKGKVVHLHSKTRLGRGRALSKAFKKSKGEIVMFMDSDLSTDLKHIKDMVRVINKGADVATGSRYIRGADIKRQFVREFVSRIFNFSVRLLFNYKIKDHQCGFKGFKRKSLMTFIDDIKDNHWFWDTECLIRAQKKGLVVYEFPVKWRCSSNTKVKLLNDSENMGVSMIKLWFDMRKEK